MFDCEAHNTPFCFATLLSEWHSGTAMATLSYPKDREHRQKDKVWTAVCHTQAPPMPPTNIPPKPHPSPRPTPPMPQPTGVTVQSTNNPRASSDLPEFIAFKPLGHNHLVPLDPYGIPITKARQGFCYNDALA